MNQRGGWLDIEKGRRGWTYFQRLSQNIRRGIFFLKWSFDQKPIAIFFCNIFSCKNEKELYEIYTIFDFTG